MIENNNKYPNNREKRIRSITKAITWRISATLLTILLVYIFTSNVKASLGIGGSELITKLIIYYIHERIWLKITWGTKEI